jgi:methionyl-tRNA synthetase
MDRALFEDYFGYKQGMAKTKYYVTTPVYDAASPPRVGTLYTAILGDAIARHKRMCGFDVAHHIGFDAHGGQVDGAGERPSTGHRGSLERNSEAFEQLLKRSDICCTHFSLGSSAQHISAVQTLLQRIMRRSRLAIYKAKYEGRYCAHDGIDVSQSAEPADCRICGRAADLLMEERHFFRLSTFQDRLLALYKFRPEFIQPQFRGPEIENLVCNGLKDISISRISNGHGVPWPDDPDRFAYGCCSQLAGYLSGIGFGKGGFGSDEFKKYWPPNLQVIGKEALLWHAVYWPAFLMAADLPLPRHIFAHGTVGFDQAGADSVAFLESAGLLGSDHCATISCVKFPTARMRA